MNKGLEEEIEFSSVAGDSSLRSSHVNSSAKSALTKSPTSVMSPTNDTEMTPAGKSILKAPTKYFTG